MPAIAPSSAPPPRKTLLMPTALPPPPVLTEPLGTGAALVDWPGVVDSEGPGEPMGEVDALVDGDSEPPSGEMLTLGLGLGLLELGLGLGEPLAGHVCVRLKCAFSAGVPVPVMLAVPPVNVQPAGVAAQALLVPFTITTVAFTSCRTFDWSLKVTVTVTKSP